MIYYFLASKILFLIYFYFFLMSNFRASRNNYIIMYFFFYLCIYSVVYIKGMFLRKLFFNFPNIFLTPKEKLHKSFVLMNYCYFFEIL